jgi:hypothetical protein
MKRDDYIVMACAAAVLFPFVFVDGFFAGFRELSASRAYPMSFLKFAVLATFGECLALRIVAGRYWRPGFGLVAKMIVWGLFGVVINAAFVTFATGAPNILAGLGMKLQAQPLANGTFLERLAASFAVSCAMNLTFGPVLMIAHRITDAHIHEEGGRLRALVTSIPVGSILSGMDWNAMWGFVLKKTIPLFWIPAHTITFLLPPELRAGFAALLGIALGVILAFARLRPAKGHNN